MTLMDLSPSDAFLFFRTYLEWYAKWSHPSKYLEIGYADGDTCKLVHDYVDRIYAIDPEGNEGALAGPKWHPYQTDSDSFFQTIDFLDDPDGPLMFDLVFIDGDHDGAQVLKDIYNSLNHLSEGGLIVCHDTYPPTEAHTHPAWSGTAYQAIDVLRIDRSELQILTFPVTYGMTLISRIPQLMWNHA